MSGDVCSSILILQPSKMDTGMSTSSLMLTNTNYRHWAMRMELTLEAHDLWGVIDEVKKIARKIILPCQ